METYIITVNGVQYEVQVEKKGAAPAAAGVSRPAFASAPASAASAPAPFAPAAPAAAAQAAPKREAAGSVRIEAGAAGKVWKIVAAPGQAVKTGDTVVIIEAMKMEIPVVAPQDGTVASIDCAEGESIEAGAVLATLK